MVDEAAWNQTVDIAQTTKNAEGDTVLTKAPEGTAYTNEYVEKALDEADGRGRRRHGRRVQAADGDAERRRRLELLGARPGSPPAGLRQVCTRSGLMPIASR